MTTIYSNCFVQQHSEAIGRTLGKQLENYAKADPAKQAQLTPVVEEMATEMFKELHLPAEKDLLAAQLALYTSKSTGYNIAPMANQIG